MVPTPPTASLNPPKPSIFLHNFYQLTLSTLGVFQATSDTIYMQFEQESTFLGPTKRTQNLENIKLKYPTFTMFQSWKLQS